MNLDNVNKVDGAVGLTMSRLEAWEKANGAAIFTEDMVLAGMLHGALALSKVAHALL
jgi:CO/xanthine dehydrogenase Mo-binding subunit